MTRAQVQWAKQHDWYQSVFQDVAREFGDMTVIVREVVTGMPTRYLRFNDYHALRAWAGY